MFRCVIRARTLFRLQDDININNPMKFTLWNISHNIDIFLVEGRCEMFGVSWEDTLFRLYNRVLLPTIVTYKQGKFLFRAVSSPYDYSKRFTLHPLADLFIPRPF